VTLLIHIYILLQVVALVTNWDGPSVVGILAPSALPPELGELVVELASLVLRASVWSARFPFL